MLIAVDGPLASGKGTIARAIAARFGLPHLDTGSLYRATAVLMLDAGESPHDADAATQAAKLVDPANIDERRIRSASVGAAASVLSVHPGVREALFHLQQDFAARPGGAVLDGRDIGTVIAPHADVKLFVTADPEIRAGRRHAELINRGEEITFEQVLTQLKERDGRDAARKDSPMRQADDAILLDTSNLSIDGAVSEAVRLVQIRTGQAPD
ncbi:(d)CMP kinase [Woodsholea maritima]|uniref:(d)CMP kinase n=1 Tax=Woodsholea maritima TaxID=240237 RepID=UPI000378686B|nr:(d)CMP kinase [Woodsholea maritima]